jgi:outer membrane receptor protein involved in Fe transport
MGLDKKVFNVGKDLASQGGTAAELLDNVPTLQVDVEGNVSLRGSQSVRILIDGRPSGLIGSDPAAGLRAIPSNMIERIEVITNPSARYEAEGMSGIINIILKKDQRGGFNGSFDVITGWPANFGTSFNLNYRANKFNFFANYGISYREGPGGGNQYQEFVNGDTTFITTQNSARNRSGLNNSLRFGSDYAFSATSQLTMAATLRKGDDNNLNETRYVDYLNTVNNPLQIVERTDEESEDEWRTEFSLSYRKEFAKEDQKFTADIRYQQNTESESSDLQNRYFTPEFDPADTDDLFQRTRNEELSDNLIFQADYVHPFGEEGRFEIGLRSSIRNIDNDYLVEEFQDSEWQALQGLSNDFRYDENISAAYLILGNKLGKFSWQIGVRPEYSLISTKLLQTDEVNDRDYLNVFPSAFLGYELPGNNSLQVSYSRRVNRPRFWDLNPFFSFSDDRNFRSGNPNLNPEFTDSYEISHIKYWDSGSVGSSIYYRHTTDKIDRIRRVLPNNTSVSQPENLLTEDAFGLEVTTSYDPYKWWRLSADFNFFRAITDGGNIDESLTADTYSWFTRGTSRFTVDKKTDVQVRFNYRAPQRVTQGRRLAMYSIDLAASRDILSDKGTLTLSVRDLLNSRKWRYITEGEGPGFSFYTEGDFQWRARQVTLTFNYRLNQKKQRGRGDGQRGDYEGGDGEF